MSNRAQAVTAVLLASMITMACGDGGGSAGAGGASGPAAGAVPTTVIPASRPSPTTTTAPIQGVETFAVEGGHRDGPLTYPQVPPVGGPHNPTWTRCAFYDRAVANEMAVHSLEHGAIWITYRPDLPQDQIEVLAALAGGRKDILVSRWDDGLPSPLVASAWGRQLKLTAATDPRLADFVRLYANQGPEPNAPC